jgi:hypothetical protein
MTPENKKTTYWTGGILAVLIAAMAILWATGLLQAPPAQ